MESVIASRAQQQQVQSAAQPAQYELPQNKKLKTMPARTGVMSQNAIPAPHARQPETQHIIGNRVVSSNVRSRVTA